MRLTPEQAAEMDRDAARYEMSAASLKPYYHRILDLLDENAALRDSMKQAEERAVQAERDGAVLLSEIKAWREWNLTLPGRVKAASKDLQEVSDSLAHAVDAAVHQTTESGAIQRVAPLMFARSKGGG